MRRFIPLALLMLFLCAACNRQPTSTADVPRLLSQTYKIAVAPFSQPLHAGQLIMGNIPENQGKIPPDDLLALDLDLRHELQTHTRRQYNFLNTGNAQVKTPASGQPKGLQFWVNYGREHSLEYILVPQVLDWHERDGSEAGVQKSAHMRVEFFLINVPNALVVNRSVYEEKQVGLVDNLLGVADFVKRKGQWVSARQLAGEGMLKAIKELGL